MRILVAGSRKGILTPRDKEFLAALRPVLVVTGGYNGIDTEAMRWAGENGVARLTFYANWTNLGRAAGPTRNRAMARYLAGCLPPRRVVLFPGHAGTADMEEAARAAKLDILYPRRKGLWVDFL